MRVMDFLDDLQEESQVLESRVISAYLLGMYKKQFNRQVWDRLNIWIDGVDHWAAADHLCIDIYAHFPVFDPEYYVELGKEVLSSNFWRRRIAIVRFVKHIRMNPKAVEKMLPLMDKILDDKQYYVRKAIPWILREASKSNATRIKAYIDDNRSRMKKSEIREASKYL